MPRNFGSPSHVLLREVGDGGRVVARFGWRPLLLRGAGRDTPTGTMICWRRARPALDIWETEYLQVLQGDDPVLKWTRSTALRPVQERR